MPEGKKLPKGAKAVTSDRPGETRRITFYQLSSEIIVDKDDKAITSMLLHFASRKVSKESPLAD